MGQQYNPLLLVSHSNSIAESHNKKMGCDEVGWKYGVIFDDAKSFLKWLSNQQNAKIIEVHVHHTYEPSHNDFNGSNHRQLQDNMKHYHVNKRGFSDIAQHITIFPDGKIVTGRNVNTAPASASGYNDADSDGQHPFMFEMLGNFDKGHDNLTGSQLQSVIDVTRYYYGKCAKIRFHREMANKSCPGTGVGKTWFVNLIKKGINIENTRYSRILKLKKPLMCGNDIRKVQKRLKSKSVDGLFGSQTEQDVKSWQKVHDENGTVVEANKGLVVDGEVGPKTWKALFGNV